MGLMVIAVNAQARPVSYPGGWTAMAMNNGDVNSLHLHYSPTANYSIGVRSAYHRKDDYWHQTLQLNNLIKRWNMPDAQANLYLKSGIGGVYSDAEDYDGKTALAGFTGIAADWENRRFFTSYDNRYMEAGALTSDFKQSARIGVAPYIGDYGDLHTWLMLEIEHEPEADEPVTVTPLIRLFKGVHLVEAGMSNQGDVLFNYVIRY
tara:strand:+ start:871 stop:1488 length:618 start_codon:yes stop_codon:yes gene_type:complete